MQRDRSQKSKFLLLLNTVSGCMFQGHATENDHAGGKGFCQGKALSSHKCTPANPGSFALTSPNCVIINDRFVVLQWCLSLIHLMPRMTAMEGCTSTCCLLFALLPKVTSIRRMQRVIQGVFIFRQFSTSTSL
jgi:hypothetical protein